jgi:hypothetical protein
MYKEPADRWLFGFPARYIQTYTFSV